MSDKNQNKPNPPATQSQVQQSGLPANNSAVKVQPAGQQIQAQVPAQPSKLNNLKNGPVEDQSRQCTDVLWLVVFLLFSGTSMYIAHTSYSAGDPLKLAAVYDPDRKK